MFNQHSKAFPIFLQVTQKQLKSLMLLQRQLNSITPEMATAPGSGSSQEETVETSPIDKVDLKGKSPVDIKDEDIRPSSSDGAPTNTRIHDLASLLTLKEQGMVTSPPVPEVSDITQRNGSIIDETSPDDGRQPGHDRS